MIEKESVKRISLELPAQSFEIVRRAAELSGSTIRSFAASAVLHKALQVNLDVGAVMRELVVRNASVATDEQEKEDE